MADLKPITVTDLQQTKVSEPDSNGSFHDVWHVHFTTPSGVRTHIKMPDTQRSAENVAAAIHHEATQVEQVQALQDVPIPPPQPAAPAV